MTPVQKTELLLNFCRSVLRSDDELLRSAMRQYERFLASQASR